MTSITPLLIGLFISAVVSVLGSPVFEYVWGHVHPASTVFVLMAIAIRFAIKRGYVFELLLTIIIGIFLFDFLMGKFYVDNSPAANGIILLFGSLIILALTVAFVPIVGLVKRDDKKALVFYTCIMGGVIYMYGVVYGGITPGVSDGPKLAAIVSVVIIKLRHDEELITLWNILFVMGVLGSFAVPAISIVGGVVGETF